jgi:hypothetical protein
MGYPDPCEQADVNEPSSTLVKKLLRVLAYLPIILLGIVGSVVVVDMWHIAGVGRQKASVANKQRYGDPTVTPSPSRSAAATVTH